MLFVGGTEPWHNIQITNNHAIRAAQTLSSSPSPVVSLGGGGLGSVIRSSRLVSGQAGLGVTIDTSFTHVHAASAGAALVVLVTGGSVLAALSSKNKTKQKPLKNIYI